MMKVYCLAYIDSQYMFPVANAKIYKRLGDAKKACEKKNAINPERPLKAVVLVADNWHKEENMTKKEREKIVDE